MSAPSQSADDGFELSTAASGFAWVTTPSRRQHVHLGRLLMFRYGFWRWGVYLPAITDEAIYPDFVRFGLRIHSGWDNCSGYDLLAANAASDRFLRRFYEKHCASRK